MPPLSPHAGHIGLVLPLCTSAATVGLALYQYPVFLSFLQPDSTGQSIAGKPLSRFWHPMVKQGRILIASLAASSTIGGALAARWLQTHITLETTNVSHWYIAGTVLAAGHLASLPIVAGPVGRIIKANEKDDTEAEKQNREEMKTWLTIHTVRTLAIDLPALWCFAEGLSQSLWVGPA
ncbi:transport SEC61 subunit alpha [Lecanosticta acicola]|uniref:Transport SEC61 subunit alpha n=1 Tax=Lecanosticta acicola TaxID=111012 RepID=A0AAI8Z4E2_9PEZI|nr:transport SEC61 subunit alpha [Lecanosticta acicola]